MLNFKKSQVGAFTESSAYNLNKLSKEKRDEVLKAYFSKEGANYSLTSI